MQLEIKTDFEESVWAEIQLANQDKLIVGCIYRSPSCSTQNNEDLNKLLADISQRNHSHVLVMGDFNFPSIDWATRTVNSNDTSRADYQFIECIQSTYWFQHSTENTRARGSDTPSLIDLVFTNEENMISNMETLSPLGKSDHAILSFCYECYIENNKGNHMKLYYDKGDYDEMRSMMNLDWDHLLTTKDVPQQWNTFVEILQDAVSRCVPSKIITPGKTRTKQQLPLEQSIRDKIKDKHKKWKKYIRNKSQANYQDYCKTRNQVRNITRNSLKQHEKEITNQIKTNPKQFWNYVKSKTKTKVDVTNLEIPGTKQLTDSDAGKAEVLLNYFSSVFTIEPDGAVPNLPKRESNSSLHNLSITADMVEKKLKSLNVSKSQGPDQIHARILKELSKEISQPIATIFQSSLDSGVLPEVWSTATVTAIFKKGSRKSPENYRPVSLTCILCKVMEGVIRDAIYNHLKTNKLFSDRQYGFISGRSTVLQLLHVLDKWTQILDKKGTVDVIYMDFQKAFDKVPHRRLISKIESHNVEGPVLRWVASFLANRKQQVRINDTLSDWASVTSGIPQGSVLGPLLFVIYINDLPEAVSSEVYMFADDTKLFRDVSNPGENDKLQTDLYNLQEWSDTWLLKFHPGKCKVMAVSTKQREQHEYFMKSGAELLPLEYTEEEKDIGVTIDPSLSFDKHIALKVNKANSIMGIIRRTFVYLEAENFLPLYKGLVRPHLEYANVVWHPYKKKHTEAIERVQRRATKLIPSLKDMPYCKRLETLKLPTMSYRRARGDVIESYKMLSGLYDEELSCILPLQEDHRTRGHSKRIFQLGARLNIRQNFFSLRICKMWNSLPESVISAPTLNTFKNRVDKFWSTQEFLYNHESPFFTGSDSTQIANNEDELSIEA